MLDEATSQVSQEMEQMLYLTCKHLRITIMSIGHRDSIRCFHTMTLHFEGDAGWSFKPSDPSTAPGGNDESKDERRAEGEQLPSHRVPLEGAGVSETDS